MGLHKNANGSWEAPLPFKSDDLSLADNKGQIQDLFACSAAFENESLNKYLLQGPDQFNSLIGLLTRFRKEEVSFTCDIAQMFHSFYANPKDRTFCASCSPKATTSQNQLLNTEWMYTFLVQHCHLA